MTSIPLQPRTIRRYLGGDRFNSCQNISNIHLQFDDNSFEATVEARIPASTTRQPHYTIKIQLRNDGSEILHSSCTCPIGARCKHIHKVLCRIADSPVDPIKGLDREIQAHRAKCRRLADQMEHASVYIAFHCMSECDSGSDYRRSYWVKEKFDEEILGVFFSKALANQCAREYVRDELGVEMDDDDEDDEDDDADDEEDAGSYVYDGEDCPEGNSFDKVWVERRAIEDASPRFRK